MELVPAYVLQPLEGFRHTDVIRMQQNLYRRGRVYTVHRGQFGSYKKSLMKFALTEGVLRDLKGVQERKHGDLVANEVYMLQFFADCENIVKILHHEVSPTHHCVVVMEYSFNCSEYLQQVEQGVKNGNEFDLPDLFKQLFEALRFIHNESIVHRDLRTKHIYLNMGHPSSNRSFLKLGGFKFAKDQHTIDSGSDVENPDVDLPRPRNEFQADKFQAAFVMYCFLKQRDIRAPFVTPTFEGDEMYNWKQLHLAHLIKCVFANPSSNIQDILSHIFFWDLDRLVSYEDRMRTLNATDTEMEKYLEDGKILVFQQEDWSELVPSPVVEACKNINFKTFVGLWMARQLYPDEDDDYVRSIAGPTQNSNFEFWESLFPAFSLYLYKRIASYRYSGHVLLHSFPQFAGSYYFPSSSRFYETVSDANIYHNDTF